MMTTNTIRNKKQQGYQVNREELAALELLRSTGMGVLEAAQVACAAARAGGGEMKRALRCIEEGKKAVEASERTVSFAEAGWASVEARSDRRKTTQ